MKSPTIRNIASLTNLLCFPGQTILDCGMLPHPNSKRSVFMLMDKIKIFFGRQEHATPFLFGQFVLNGIVTKKTNFFRISPENWASFAQTGCDLIIEKFRFSQLNLVGNFPMGCEYHCIDYL